MQPVLALLNIAFFLAGSVWLGGLVMLALGNWQIEKLLKDRRPEAGQITLRLRTLFQKIELACLLVMWVANVAVLILLAIGQQLNHPPTTVAHAMKLGFMLLATLAAIYGHYHLSPKLLAQSPADAGNPPPPNGNDPAKPARNGVLLQMQAKVLLWSSIILATLTVIAAVIAITAGKQ